MRLLIIAAIGTFILLLLLFFLLRHRKKQKAECLLVERVRTTDAYQSLYPVLRTASRCCVDRVIIRRNEVRIVLFRPMNTVCRFIFEERGFDPIADQRVLHALALAISVDMEQLRDEHNYSFAVREETTLNSQRDVWFEYNIQPRYKDMMTKRWYQKPEIEDGIIR